MKIRLLDGQPFVRATITFRSQTLALDNMLLDTGSAGTLLSAERIAPIGIVAEAEDNIHQIRGVGGVEFVFSKFIDRVTVDRLQLSNFEVEIGLLDYGFPLDGIIGLDFMVQVGTIIDLKRMELY